MEMLRSPPKRGPKSGDHLGRIIEEPFAKNLVATPFLPGDFVEAAHLARFYKWPGREIPPPLANGTAAAWQRRQAPAPRARAAPADRPRRPAVIREQLAGKKRSHRHRPEHQEIVEGLNLVAFLRQMRFQHQRRGAPTTPKFQPTPSTMSVAQKCIAVMPERPMVAISPVRTPQPVPMMKATLRP